MIKVGDCVRINPKVIEKYITDSILKVSRDTIYKVTSLDHDIFLNPLSPHGIGPDGLPYDDSPRWIVTSQWIDNDVEKSFILVCPENKKTLTQVVYKHICPLCNSKGDDLVFKFYCTNKSCRNWHS